MRPIIVLIILFAAALAHAQPAKEPKSPTIAVAVSIGVPVAGAITMAVAPKDGVKALGFVAMYFGPSMGLWYAGKGGGLGLGLRTLAIAGGVGALLLTIDEECDDSAPCTTTGSDYLAGSILVGAAGLWIGSSIYDVVLARRAVHEWNHNLTLTPGLVGNQHAPGVFIGGQF